MVKQAVILAGGMGTRLRPFTDDNPKPMIPIEDRPFLYYLLMQLKEFGITYILLLLGYRAEKIMDYFGDGSSIGIKLCYSVTPAAYDTGSRIKDSEEQLASEFLLLYCDNFCPIDLEKAYRMYVERESLVQITAYANKDGYTKNNLIVTDGQVRVYDKSRTTPGLSGVDIGYAFIKKEVLKYLCSDKIDENFERVVYPRVIEQKQMSCYMTEHRYYSIGSWERMELTREFFRPRKIVFLDRDGTLNVRAPKACYIETPEQFEWLPKAREAVGLLKRRGYEIYLISNQPGVARGMVTEDNLEAIHAKMLADLQPYDATIDGIYICPHGWDEGCDCRKPRSGMLYQAQKEHSINLRECILIGDDERDIEAGVNAGLEKNILVDENYTLWDAVQDLF